jgi:hypothetical protein
MARSVLAKLIKMEEPDFPSRHVLSKAWQLANGISFVKSQMASWHADKPHVRSE